MGKVNQFPKGCFKDRIQEDVLFQVHTVGAKGIGKWGKSTNFLMVVLGQDTRRCSPSGISGAIYKVIFLALFDTSTKFGTNNKCKLICCKYIQIWSNWKFSFPTPHYGEEVRKCINFSSGYNSQTIISGVYTFFRSIWRKWKSKWRSLNSIWQK